MCMKLPETWDSVFVEEYIRNAMNLIASDCQFVLSLVCVCVCDRVRHPLLCGSGVQ